MVQEQLQVSKETHKNDKVYREKKHLKKEPLLRFSEFNNEWESIKLGDFLEFIPTNSFSRAKLNLEEGSIKNIHYGDIHTKFSTIVDVSEEEIPYINLDVETSKLKKEHYCKEGDLIIADASEDYEDIGKSIELINVNTSLVSGLHTILARDKIHKTATGFKGYYFLTEDLRKKMKINANGISVLGISKKNIANFEINLPSIEEQEKIVKFLYAIDKKIELLEKILSLYKKDTNYYINQVYSNILNYEKLPLKKLVKAYSSNLSINKLEENEGKYDIYGADGIIKQIDFYEMEEPYIAIIKDGAGVGRLSLCNEFSSALGTLQCLTPNEDIEINFLYYYLRRLNFKKYIVGSIIPHIYFKDYSKEKLKIPSYESQKEIGDFISKLEKRNYLIKNKIKYLNNFKQGLLQRMFI